MSFLVSRAVACEAIVMLNFFETFDTTDLMLLLFGTLIAVGVAWVMVPLF
jgi:hypothetical protein